MSGMVENDRPRGKPAKGWSDDITDWYGCKVNCQMTSGQGEVKKNHWPKWAFISNEWALACNAYIERIHALWVKWPLYYRPTSLYQSSLALHASDRNRLWLALAVASRLRITRPAAPYSNTEKRVSLLHCSIALPIWTCPQTASSFVLSISQTLRVVDLCVSFFGHLRAVWPTKLVKKYTDCTFRLSFSPWTNTATVRPNSFDLRCDVEYLS